MSENHLEEVVLCVPREKLVLAQGLDLNVARHLAVINDPANRVYKKRAEAETDPAHKQLIPYVLFISSGKILRYRRGKRGSESRLYGKLSVGIGGHISEHTANPTTDLQAGMMRELEEEMGWQGAPPVAVAILNDDSNDVGAVHLGIVYLMPTEEEDITARCASIADPEFVDLAEAVKELDRYETWSALCLEHIRPLLGKGLATLVRGS